MSICTNKLRQLKLVINVFMINPQPSTKTNNSILNGSEIITGGSITIPIDINTLATTISIIKKGMNIKNLNFQPPLCSKDLRKVLSLHY